MKVNKYVLNSCIAALILAILLIVFFLCIKLSGKKSKPANDNNPATSEQITISFDSDGGDSVKDMKIKKGETINLPVITKKDYLLDGWYLDNTKVTNKTKFIKDTKLKAKWNKVADGAETFTITFNSKGGTEVGKLTVECEKELKLPDAPTKDGYKFISWVDKNDTPILDGALLTCHDITLYANWEKEEKYFTVSFDSKGGSAVDSIKVKCGDTLTLPVKPTKKDYTFDKWVDKNEMPILNDALLSCEDIKLSAVWIKNEAKKTYTCPEGYELKDTNKCVAFKDVESYCPDGYTFETDGICVNKSARNDGTRTCKKEYIDGDYRTGTYIQSGGSPVYCGYFELPSYTGSSEQCSNHGGTLSTINNHCYKVLKINNYEVSCGANERYFETQAIEAGSLPGCYKIKQKDIGCKNYDGYTMNHTYGKCVKIIDATLK